MKSLQLAVIDLDNTLYTAEQGVFARMDTRMTNFITRELGVSRKQADDLRIRYWRQYGTTLRGLMLHHGVDAEHFLQDVHDVQAHELLEENEVLDMALSALPMRKVIHTNGIVEHAERVLNALGVRHHFSAIYDIRFHQYMPKPCQASLQMLLQKEDVHPEKAVVFDDMEDNLHAAEALGLRTCLISSKKEKVCWDWHVARFEDIVCLS